MPTTTRGIWYPASGDHTRLWEHLQQLATTADTAVDNLAKKTAGGQFSGTTATTGYVDVPHGLGVAPKSVVATPAVAWPPSGAYHLIVSSWTATGFRVYARYFNNTAVNVTIQFNWVAIA